MKRGSLVNGSTQRFFKWKTDFVDVLVWTVFTNSWTANVQLHLNIFAAFKDLTLLKHCKIFSSHAISKCFTHREKAYHQAAANKHHSHQKRHRVNTKTATRVATRQTVVQLNYWIYQHQEKIYLPVDVAVIPGGVMLLWEMKLGTEEMNTSGREI